MKEENFRVLPKYTIIRSFTQWVFAIAVAAGVKLCDVDWYMISRITTHVTIDTLTPGTNYIVGILYIQWTIFALFAF